MIDYTLEVLASMAMEFSALAPGFKDTRGRYMASMYNISSLLLLRAALLPFYTAQQPRSSLLSVFAPSPVVSW